MDAYTVVIQIRLKRKGLRAILALKRPTVNLCVITYSVPRAVLLTTDCTDVCMDLRARHIFLTDPNIPIVTSLMCAQVQFLLKRFLTIFVSLFSRNFLCMMKRLVRVNARAILERLWAILACIWAFNAVTSKVSL